MTGPAKQARGYTPDPWAGLRTVTDARIALGRAGCSLPTSAHLDFQLAHALARDAVHTEFLPQQIASELNTAGIDSVFVCSQAPDRNLYLQRPDLGRKLAPEDSEKLPAGKYDIALVIGDGLSARATHEHAGAIAQRLYHAFLSRRLNLAPVVIARGARVALADEIGEKLRASLAIILLGERPGLSSANSLGAYLTWGPRVGRHDAQRNCVSNIRPDGGLSYELATHKLIYLSLEAIHLKLSGVDLKDNSTNVPLLS